MKAMLTKNTMKRTIKLSQIKEHSFFSDFDWDGLISFNMESAYKLKLPEDKLKDEMCYLDYAKVI